MAVDLHGRVYYSRILPPELRAGGRHTAWRPDTVAYDTTPGAACLAGQLDNLVPLTIPPAWQHRRQPGVLWTTDYYRFGPGVTVLLCATNNGN